MPVTERVQENVGTDIGMTVSFCIAKSLYSSDFGR
jgi:hypothetical protein